MIAALPRISVAVCDTQPITAEGVRRILEATPGFEFRGSTASLPAMRGLTRSEQPQVIILDKSFGIQPVLEWMAETRRAPGAPAMVVWGGSVSEPEALRLLQGGAKGMIRKTVQPDKLLACLRVTGTGGSWMEEVLFRETGRGPHTPSKLTVREEQILGLVEQGYKNKDIAHELGISPGTVKIHLKHVFEKTGVRGRYGLALNGLQNKGLIGAVSIATAC